MVPVGLYKGSPITFFVFKLRLTIMATTLHPNTVSKLYYLDNRIKSFYEKNGYSSIPFDGRKVQEMIQASQKELAELFLKIWGKSMGAHLLDKFYDNRGNVLDFYMSLDGQNRQLLSQKDW
ncbi:MAG: hypothetical protein CVU09_15005 [Bacteroidetes bacterium HGW-Bacteroidetes-4]|jgi:hypothetical protein|nr:MAG: hypothetical protein CVU09_15005 [Bacteroidetes bacterium HGW-Bacteroidetes-4]